MTAMTDFLENAFLNQVLRNLPYAPASTDIYCALFTTPTDDAGGGSEVSPGLGYSRQLVATFDPPVGGVSTNSVPATFGPATSPWGLVTNFAVYDSLVGGNMLFHGPLTVPKTVNIGDNFVFPAGNISVSAD